MIFRIQLITYRKLHRQQSQVFFVKQPLKIRFYIYMRIYVLEKENKNNRAYENCTDTITN